MPITPSATKRARQSKVRNARLLPYKTRLKTIMRQVKDAAKAGKKEDVIKLLPEAYKIIDTAAKKNLIHKKNAGRKKSSLAKLAAAK
jgi:small subunit ribosomal protein S20